MIDNLFSISMIAMLFGIWIYISITTGKWVNPLINKLKKDILDGEYGIKKEVFGYKFKTTEEIFQNWPEARNKLEDLLSNSKGWDAKFVDDGDQYGVSTFFYFPNYFDIPTDAWTFDWVKFPEKEKEIFRDIAQKIFLEYKSPTFKMQKLNLKFLEKQPWYEKNKLFYDSFEGIMNRSLALCEVIKNEERIIKRGGLPSILKLRLMLGLEDTRKYLQKEK